jgi:dephospho-CoA kinase
MYLIGLTGNIACGKSTVVAMLKELGAQVLDADQVARAVVEPGEPAYEGVVAAFGARILTAPGGAIDRPALGRIVFGDAAELRRLEAIVLPAVHATIERWLEQQRQAGTPVAVLDAIKLIEGGWPERCDAVWVVSCRPEQQLERLVGQRGMSPADAQARIAAQGAQAEKLAHADVVIENSGGLEATRAQVLAAWPIR